MISEFISASFDYYRDLRDALSEALFFQIYGSLFELYLSDKQEVKSREPKLPMDRRDLPVVKEALESIDKGGYAEALCRTGYMLERKGMPIPLSRLEIKHELMEKFKDLLPDLEEDERRRIRGIQEIICRFEPDKAVETLPRLLANENDKKRFKTLLDRLLADPRFSSENLTKEQQHMVDRIQETVFPKKQKKGKKQP
jgi:hypothetical protein